MRKYKFEEEKHHPYCAYLYKKYDNQKGSIRYWSCSCSFLKDYDNWNRETHKEKDTI